MARFLSTTLLPPSIPKSVSSLMPRALLRREHHPLNILKTVLHSTLPTFQLMEDLSPIVSVKNCFDDLLVPHEHVSRRPSDTFYVTPTTVLRPHTSAHQTTLLPTYDSFLVTGDVYRRDEIDATHFPVFHQMEGVKVLPRGSGIQDAVKDLKHTLEATCDALFGHSKHSRRWVDDAFFPFTTPSAELEISYRGKEFEVLGCGVVHPQIMSACGRGDRVAWAFGLGLERLAMIMFDIPDIRLFWSQDVRFLSQFENGLARFQAGDVPQFKPYSKYPAVIRDVSFWISGELSDNDVYSIIRDVAGQDVESVALVDRFVHPTSKRESRSFRIVYRSMDRNLTNEMVNVTHGIAQDRLKKELFVELR